jgi:hypothetical protein
MMAASGYWKNWERNTGWLMREIVFELIRGNPNYKNESKPNNVKEILKLSDDSVKIRQKEDKKITPEELEEVRRRLMGKLKQ